MRPAALLLLAAPFLAGCLPYYHPDPGLEKEREEAIRLEEAHPQDPRYPQARYAICLKLADSLAAEPPSALPLTDKVHGKVANRAPAAGTCCLGSLAFLADVAVMTPLRAVRTLVTMPVAWGRKRSLRKEAGKARERWQALEAAPASPSAAP